ncbi:hypothetical protein [Paenibacillus aceris]|uniref:Uncharacterized protein n=1 Tax=Paenibacillus aceris TaxID=869555 RepID=A0ABS4I9I9_9BACL|nr:hypothetical protein [Paenibacillus aceris]MBP1967573.1 hypothetical protein [Paenibacillus aceris]NHW37565.1 hypothetical protein [Paenibacillus aceris]
MYLFERRLERYIEASKALLASEGIDEVLHYFRHDEYEMAYEGLLIELTNIGEYPLNIDFLEWKELGEHYRLDKEFVFDSFIWEKFINWGKLYSDKSLS